MRNCEHDYEKWSDPYNSFDVRDCGSFGNTVKVDTVMQERVCKDCNITEARDVRTGKLPTKAKEKTRRGMVAIIAMMLGLMDYNKEVTKK